MNDEQFLNAVRLLAEGHNVVINWHQSDIQNRVLMFDKGLKCTEDDLVDFITELDRVFGEYIC